MNNKCKVCARPLTSEKSKELGMGPVCASKNKAHLELEPNEACVQRSYSFGDDFVFKRLEDGSIEYNVPRRIVRHSPDGFEWGYGGSGPADLALNIMAIFWKGQNVPPAIYQGFKREFIVSLPEQGGTIAFSDAKKYFDKAVKQYQAQDTAQGVLL